MIDPNNQFFYDPNDPNIQNIEGTPNDNYYDPNDGENIPAPNVSESHVQTLEEKIKNDP